MSEWLSKLHEFYTHSAPFVIATITTFNGNSPDHSGACVFFSDRKTASFVKSEIRSRHMLATCKTVLQSKQSFQIEKHELGDIAGSTNGHCVITYEFFHATDYPVWLQQLQSNLQLGIDSVWLRVFNQSHTEVVDHIVTAQVTNQSSYTQQINNVADYELEALALLHQKPTDNCQLINIGDTTALLRAVRRADISLILIGDHPVSAELIKQIAVLPIALTKVDTEDLGFTKNLVGLNYVIIMTGDHELDFKFCEIAFDHSAVMYLGCMGSEKKAQLFKTQLEQRGATQSQVDKLTMPIGLTQISGKQTTVIAASIVAQLMSLHHW